MEVNVTNIPKDKFYVIQQEILRVLVKSGIEEIDNIALEDGLSNEFIGCEFEIKIGKSKAPAIVSSSVCG